MKTVEQVEKFWLKRKAAGAMWNYPDGLPRLARLMGVPLGVLEQLTAVGVIPLSHVTMDDKCFDVVMSEDVMEFLKGCLANN
jgi:hypothetical protein